MSEAPTTHDRELAALWASLPLGQRSAAGTLRALAASTGIDEALLERHWREALLTEVELVAAAETGQQLAGAGLERSSAAEAVTASVRILSSVAARYPQLLDQDARPASPEFERAVAAPLRAVLQRAQAEGVLRDDVPLEQLGASLRGLLRGTLRAALRSGADPRAAGTVVARLFLEAARPQTEASPSPR
jgi:hypothetical protein